MNSGAVLNAVLSMTGLPKHKVPFGKRQVDADGVARTLVCATCTYGGTVFLVR